MLSHMVDGESYKRTTCLDREGLARDASHVNCWMHGGLHTKDGSATVIKHPTSLDPNHASATGVLFRPARGPNRSHARRRKQGK